MKMPIAVTQQMEQNAPTLFVDQLKKKKYFLVDKKDDCFPDYAGPCYENADCCEVADGTECSNFICRPTKNNKDCLPDYIGPCFANDDCCGDSRCSHSFICVP